jgi:hypothetical protein
VYALHSYMTDLCFVIDPPFDCPDEDVSDATFVTVEEYVACGFVPLSASFDVGKIVDGETPVSRLPAPMSDFPIVELPEETNGQFRARVELAVANFVGRYTPGEHKACVEALPNGGRVNRVFECASVPYKPRLEPSSAANTEVAKKRKQDVGAGSLAKRRRVWWRKPLCLHRWPVVNPWL